MDKVGISRSKTLIIDLTDIGKEEDGVIVTYGSLIAHEMAHVHAYANGFRETGDDLNSKGINEMNASAVENNYRALNNLSQREYYTLDYTSNKKVIVTVPQWDSKRNGWTLSGQAWNIQR